MQNHTPNEKNSEVLPPQTAENAAMEQDNLTSQNPSAPPESAVQNVESTIHSVENAKELAEENAQNFTENIQNGDDVIQNVNNEEPAQSTEPKNEADGQTAQSAPPKTARVIGYTAAGQPIFGTVGTNFTVQPKAKTSMQYIYNEHTKQYEWYKVEPKPEYLAEKARVQKTAKTVAGGLIICLLGCDVLAALLQLVFYLLNHFGVTDVSYNAVVGTPVGIMLINLVLTLVGFLAAGVFITRRQKLKLLNIVSFEKPRHNIFPVVLAALGVCSVANVVAVVFSAVLSPVITTKMVDYGQPEGVAGFFFSVMVSACIPALIEELIFRGIIMGSLRRYGVGFAIVTSSAFFALIHGNLVQIPFAFVVGLALAVATEYTKSLWTGVVIHFANNFIATALSYLPVAEGSALQGQLEQLYMLVTIAVGLLVFFKFLLPKKILSFEKTQMLSTTAKRFGWAMLNPTGIVLLVLTAYSILLNQITA